MAAVVRAQGSRPVALADAFDLDDLRAVLGEQHGE